MDSCLFQGYQQEVKDKPQPGLSHEYLLYRLRDE